jgi:hypothetical protein
MALVAKRPDKASEGGILGYFGHGRRKPQAMHC